MSSSKPLPSILILGAGCFGLATAHHLASRGYSNITVLDKDSEVPSRFSAANDLNKVIRAEYADPFYTDLALVSSIYGLFPSISISLTGYYTGGNPKMANRPIILASLPSNGIPERHV
jgi:saccharopine dehydrogenase-like NADP-dependent oxidoreductase